MAAPPAPENETSQSAEGGVLGVPRAPPVKKGWRAVTQQFREREGPDGVSRETLRRGSTQYSLP